MLINLNYIMARKKKNKQEEFVPSKYQKDIFDFIQKQSGNLLIEAVAGSGKTTTIVKSLELIPNDKTVLFCAFNKDIVKTLTKKTKEFDNISVRTIHGLGYITCLNNIPNLNKIVNINKYQKEFIDNTSSYTPSNQATLGYQKWNSYRKNVFKLIDLARLNLANSIDDINKIAQYYEIDLINDESSAVYNLMNWGAHNQESIDYTDMVWYPNVLDFNLEASTFDYIFVDEAQDLSKAQREFVLKCNNGNTRYVFVGDGNQSIYGFSAADPESFNEIKKIKDITLLPLSVCYRCPQNVINFVKNLVKEIEPKDNAIKGEVDMEASIDDVGDNDMVLCRYNAPLLSVYTKLISQGKKTFIMGKDIGKNLIDLIQSTQFSVLNFDLSNKGVFSALYKDYFAKRNQLMSVNGWTAEMADSTSHLTNLRDNIFALEIISQGTTTSTQLIDKLSKIFEDNVSDGIILSTIHKAKGLEANNVYVLETFNYKNVISTTDWERKQEDNLIYVAYTRPKKKLGIIKDDKTKDVLPNKIINNSIEAISAYLNRVEKIVNELYSNNNANPIRLKTSFGTSNGKTLNDQPKRNADKPLSQGFLGARKVRK